jgi:Ca-activated chloride channel family protein
MSEVKLLQAPNEAAKRGLGVIEFAGSAWRLQLPVKSVDMTSSVADRLAHVTIKQTFTNPYNEHLEAVYIFPLAGGCAVSSFELRVADRVIKGEIQERAAARAQYDTALLEGKRAALLEQERDDVFTVQVGNLPPGEEVVVVVTYSEKLPYFEDGMTELRLPLVVAPRFIPGNPLDRESVGDGTALDTDMVPDASRISPPQLASGVNAKVDLKIRVILSGDKSVEDLCCSQHVTKIGTSTDGVTISLAREDEQLDRDFVLRWRVATDSLQSKFLIYRNSKTTAECFGMLSLVPPKCTDVAFAPRDVIFVVDRSGSMDNLKMVSAARSCSYLLATLSPRDRFAIQAFDNTFEWLQATNSKDNFIDADESGIQDGMRYLRTITARGGTDLDGAMKAAIAAMKKRRNTKGRQPVVVLLTDGQVGNESVIVANLQRQLGDLRVFTVGIDTAVHAGFLQKLAAIGGGTASFVQPGTELEGALSQVSREIGTPLIEKISIDDINCELDQDTIAPATIPDLFEGRAISVFFRLHSDPLESLTHGKILVKGQYADGTVFSQELSAQTTDVKALAQLWAKEYIVDLEDKFRIAQLESEKKQLRDRIIEIATQHSLLTKFTAFVVVDESEIVNEDGSLRKLVQPVQNPALWSTQAPQTQMPMRLGAGFAGAAGWGSPPPGSGQAFAPGPQSNARAAGLWESGRSMSPSMANSPASQPSKFGGGAGGGEGSYGCGVRAQVFEVIVRQGMNGADWRQICAGPMQVNNITSDEVQQEIDRRLALQQGVQPPTSQPPTSQNPASPNPTPQNSFAQNSASLNSTLHNALSKPKAKSSMTPAVKECLDRLQKILDQCFKKLQAGETPEVDDLENARLELISKLAQSSLAGSVPNLQKFLRSDLVKLIAAISGANSVNKVLQNLSRQQQKLFESIQPEISAALEESSEQPFWQTTV